MHVQEVAFFLSTTISRAACTERAWRQHRALQYILLHGNVMLHKQKKKRGGGHLQEIDLLEVKSDIL